MSIDNLNDVTETNNKKESYLAEFSTDITELAKKDLLDPVIGREDEIKRVSQILNRRTKNNPILVGDAGCGKTAIAEGIAQMIVEGNCPTNLLNKKIYSLEMSALVAGTKYRGQFEERMNNIIKEVKERDDVIIFIDEIHTMIGAGGSSGTLDAANILKPALSRGNIQCIGSTTHNEYKNSIGKDAALERRFQKVIIEEPTVNETIEIIKNLKERYEDYHNVTYTDEAVELSVKLAGRYITDRSFPDKAIDVIDEAGSNAQLSTINSVEIKDILKDIKETSQLKINSVNGQDFEKAVIYRDKEKELKEKLNIVREQWMNKNNSKRIVITGDNIRKIVSFISKVPVEKVTSNEAKKYLEMESILKKRIIGQDEAVTLVSNVLRRNKTAISNPNKPIGTFMFSGNTGVGKTELAKAISEEIFGPNSLIRIDMSEYGEKIESSKLTGAAPGYVGYEEGGQLTESVRKKPFSVVLFDEIEKAHPDVFNVLLQILDEGRLTDNSGRLIDFRNTIIILTSNVGVKNAQAKGKSISFNSSFSLSEEEDIKSNILKAMKDKFAPEFLNRINEMVTFNQLNEENIHEIVKIQIKKLKSRIVGVGYDLKWNKAVIKYIAKKTYDPKYGARPVERGIQKLVEDLISVQLLTNEPEKGTSINITYSKKEDALKATFINKK